MPERPLASAPACRVGLPGRLARAGVAIFTAAFAVSMLPSAPVVAAVAGLFALVLTIAAITGTPAGLARGSPPPREAAQHPGLPRSPAAHRSGGGRGYADQDRS